MGYHNPILLISFRLSQPEVNMAQRLENAELVSLKELMIANSIQNDAIAQLLIEEGIISQEKFFAKLKEVQAQYQSKGQ